MSAPTPTPTADRPGTKRPAAPSGASAPSGRPASKGALADSELTDDEDDAIVADTEHKAQPSKLQATVSTTKPLAVAASSGDGGGVVSAAKKERPGRARRVFLRLLARFSLAAVMPVLLVRALHATRYLFFSYPIFQFSSIYKRHSFFFF